jgi:splicing factor 3B subunit 1
MDAVEGCRVALGSGVLLGYLLQGLFHPARKVRETYWKVYNNAYIGGQEALVPAYPALQDEGENAFRRHELDVFL